MLNSSQNKLLEDYGKYLEEQGYAESSIKIYTNRIKRFFKNGFSVDDLIGSIKMQIQNYANGGIKYDPKDHANTYNALKHLAESLSIIY